MVPGFVRGAAAALERFGSGRVSWREVIEPAIELADEGFTVYPYLYRLWMPATERMRNFLESLDGPAVLGATEACAEIYLHPDGSVYEVGETLVQRDYARTLRLLAERGPDEFYEGEIGQTIAARLRRARRAALARGPAALRGGRRRSGRRRRSTI